MIPSRFPFSAVIGADDTKLALLLNALDPGIGGVLLRGQKGSAKTTLARGLAALLGDDAPFVELPVGATEDRLVGSIDLAAALTGGEQRFAPGLLAGAHGGVLYVDEINLLPDHLVDVLLDVATSGVNRVEREGISHVHPARFVLIGSMNPEEGELRPQLLDRFGLSVDVTASLDPETRAQAVERRLAFDADPDRFVSAWAPQEDTLRSRLAQNQTSGSAPQLAPTLVRMVSTLCASVGAEGLRADIVICRAATALAAWEGHDEVCPDHIRRVAPLALSHRRRRSPLDDHGIDNNEMDAALDAALDQPPPAPDPHTTPDGTGDPDDGDGGKSELAAPAGTGSGTSGQSQAALGSARPVMRLEAQRSRQVSVASGRRTTVEGDRGRVVSDRKPDGPSFPIAVGATVRAAARRRADLDVSPTPDGNHAQSPERLVAPEDLRQAVRHQRSANLVILAVDASGSMGAQRRMEAAKSAVLSLLVDAYQRRDRVALVTFGGGGAEVVLRPTSSVEVAKARLGPLVTGGRTPLGPGILAGLDLAAAARPGPFQPLLVLVTDGRATTGPPGQDPWSAALDAAQLVRRRCVASVVIDVEEGPTRLGLARQLSMAMGARHLTLDELSGPALAAAISSHTEH
ncbi:MAG: AAA family ATPase [Acidimicrobiales bacterium]